ncbi:Choline kinase alpha [Halotydeus destructor]|nr:Choline kinase alpha [Halotydeus destructor]
MRNKMAGEAAETKTRRFSDMYSHDGDITKTEALKYCSNFLGGSWETLAEEKFEMQVIPCGFVNRIFICENKGNDDSVADEPKKVVLRLYGGKALDSQRSSTDNKLDEILVYYAMSNLGLGPKLYGVFPGGRLEQYLECRMFNDADFQNPEMETLFARKLARMHVVKMPFSKVTGDQLDTVVDMGSAWSEHGKADLEAFDAGADNEVYKKYVLELDVLEEIDWLKSLKPKIKTRQVLLHGDMNRANALIIEKNQDSLDKLILIDYEFTKYGPRGVDIGSHFYNRLIDVANAHNLFKSNIDYPTETERRHFIRSYNEEMKSLNIYDLDKSENGLDNEDNMLAEAEFWVLGMFLFYRLITTNDLEKWSAMGFESFNVFKNLAETQEKYLKHKESFIQNHLSNL